MVVFHVQIILVSYISHRFVDDPCLCVWSHLVNLSKSGRAVSTKRPMVLSICCTKNSVYLYQLASTEDNFVFNIGRDHLVI